MTAAAAALAVATPALPAAAAGPGGNGTFGLTPMPGQDGRVAPYFMMTLAPGGLASATVLIRNLGNSTENLDVRPSTGVTAANGGSAFVQPVRGCAGAGCWVTGLPGTVALPAGTGEELRFMVRVPAGTQPGQYLAGITAEAAGTPQPVQISSPARAAANVVIVEQVTVGVAVTVGSLSSLRTRLSIPGVSGQDIGPTARLNIRLRNTGQTFTHGAGRAACTAAGTQRSFPVWASTVLPHDQAVIAVNAPGLPEGATLRCTVQIGYGDGLTVRWAGLVSVPAPPAAQVFHVRPGAYAVIPADPPPAWAIALLVIGVLLLVAVAVLLRQVRRRAVAVPPEDVGGGRHAQAR